MNKVVLNVKTDKEVKERAQRIAKELGVPLSVVVNAYLKEFVRNQAVNITLEPRLRPEIIKALLNAELDYRKKKNISPAFNSAGEAVRYLRSSK